MLNREQGQRRVAAVTVGLAAASLAGTVAVAAAAYGHSSATTDSGTGSDPTPSVTKTSRPNDDWLPPPDPVTRGEKNRIPDAGSAGT